MKTLEQYLLDKILESRDRIAKSKEAIVNTATGKTIELERLQGHSERFKQAQTDWKFYTLEICIHCSVDTVIVAKDILDEYTVQYAYISPNKVTAEDAAKLIKAFRYIKPEIKS